MGAGSSCCCHRNTEEEERSPSSRDVMDFRRSFRLGKAVRMPGKTGFCWCFGGTAPPEISYGIENGGMTLKPIEVEIPMPQDEEELNAKFAELVDELDLDKPHRDAMFNLPPEKKWQIYCSKKKEQEDPNSASWPDYYIERVNTMSCVFFAHDEEEIQTRAKLVDSLKTALRTQPMSFVIRFIELEGLQSLVNFLANMDYATSHSPIHTSVIGCIKALMNNSQGRAHVLAHPTCIDIIAQSLATDNLKAEVAVLEMLGAVCLVPGGHKKVLHAMCHYQKYAGERTRFQTLINDLDRDTGIYKEEVNLKTAIMSFINAALKYGPGQNHLEFRLHLRYEFLMLGLQPIIEKLRSTDNPTLERHLDFFEMVRNEDERELAKKFESSHIDTKSATAMFELLRKKLHFSVAYPHLLSLLFHLLQLPFGNTSAQHWQLIDRIVQQVTLQTKEGDPDVEPLELDVKKIVKQLANENEIKAVQTKMKEIQKENDELLSKLTKKERECEAKATEKEELISTMNKMKGKLEEEKERHLQTKLQLEELTVMVNNLQQLIECERAERMKLEHAVKTGSLPDDAKAGFVSSAAAFSTTASLVNSCIPPPPPPFGSVPPPPPPPMIGGGPPPPPPPPGFMGGPPAPPCPGGMSNGMFSGVPGLAVRTKNTPKSKNALKSFNWSKLPENKIKGTVWTEIDDAKIYSNLDLEEFEKTFSAYQRQDTGSHSKLFSEDNKPKELSVVDGRRAQNCTILLSKLKMTNQELSKAIMNMDEQEELPKDMCEQLLKFVPTPEETQLLSEHEADIDSMAKADRFLFEMSRIEHYEQRLRALYFKKKFSERLSECKPKVDAVLEASKEVQRCRYLKRVLELVLALGNYMNRGARGNASGFKIGSLNKIIDTKSSIDKRITLLHYMLETICKKFPDMLKLENEMPNVRKAAKVNMTELDAEVGVLRVGLKDIEKELAYFQKKSIGDGRKDKFVSVMSDFVTVAAYNFSELEEQVTEMKQRYEKVANTFGEDPKKSQPDEFFGVFDMFLTSFTDARLENERIKRIKEEEEKRARMEEKLRAEKEKQRRMSNGRGGKEKGEFDDLISALRTGDVFTEDMAKLKRTQRRRVSKDAVSGPNIRERSGYKAS